jgi:hypothetical protein
MPRSVISLYLANFESIVIGVFFTIICYNTIALSADYTAITKWVVDSNLVILITSSVIQFAILALEKEEPEEDVKEESIKKIAPERTSDAAKNNLDALYKSLMSVGNVYCATTFCITLYYVIFFIQAVPFGHLLDDTPRIREHSNGAEYSSSDKSAWTHAVLGTVWNLNSTTPDVYVADGASLHITGSIFFGVVLAYSSVVFVLSIYCAYSSTPVGEYNPLFLDVRSLNITNAFITFGMHPVVKNIFIGCGSPVDHMDVYTFFIIVCFDEYLFQATWEIIQLILNEEAKRVPWKKFWNNNLLDPVWITILSLMPPFWGFILHGMSEILLLVSMVLSLLCISMAWLKFLRFRAFIKRPSEKSGKSTLINNSAFSLPKNVSSSVFDTKAMRYMA